jgi:hypothetical protein
MLNSLKNELKKEFILLDASDRAIEVYQAPLHSADGDFCLKTTLEYKDAASTIVIKSKEEIGTWVTATMEI